MNIKKIKPKNNQDFIVLLLVSLLLNSLLKGSLLEVIN